MVVNRLAYDSAGVRVIINKGVPEPATWAITIIGPNGVGAPFRSCRRLGGPSDAASDVETKKQSPAARLAQRVFALQGWSVVAVTWAAPFKVRADASDPTATL